MKLPNNYITEIGNTRNFRNVFGKYQTGVAFNQTQEKDKKDEKQKKIKGESHCFHCVNQDHWAADCPNLYEEQRGQLHTSIGTVKHDVDEEGNTIGVSLFKNHQKINTRKNLDPKNI